MLLESKDRPVSRKPNVKITGSKASLNDFIWDETKGIVQSGPFQGMQLLKEEIWDDGNLGNKCLGCYEQELHSLIETQVKRLAEMENPRIINIGCAEGYYAVGLARRLPNATVWVIDSDNRSTHIAVQAAILNEVTIVPGAELDEMMAQPDLIISDCEGAEVEYLNRERFPGLDGASIIVECHDFPTQRTTEILSDRFNASHTIGWCLSEMVRAPNNFDFLVGLPSHAKWMAVSEGRPSAQYFLYMVPK